MAREARTRGVLDVMFSSCSVVMAKQCNNGVIAAQPTEPPERGDSWDTEREMGLPLLGQKTLVQELGSDAVDAERIPPPGAGPKNPAQKEFEALATAPIELSGELPATHKPGTPIIMHGPHGPITVVPPNEVIPGQRMCYRLAPVPEFRIQVPANSEPGSTLRFERSDGVEVSVVVPPNLKEGDSFEVTPPSLMVRVPEGAEPGDWALFRHSVGIGSDGREATEWCRARIPVGLRPGCYFTARLPHPKPDRVSEKVFDFVSPTKTKEQVFTEGMPPVGDGKIWGPSCMLVQRAEDTEDKRNFLLGGENTEIRLCLRKL